MDFENNDFGMTVAEQVANRLREEIITAKFEPGSRITVKELSDRYNISGQPIREAIHMLAGEKLLQLAPYKGATVMAITSDFIAEASELTSALELLMLPHAMEAGFSDEHIQELETINKAFEESISQQDARPRRLNEKFHITLFKNCKDSIAFGLFDRYFKTMYAYARNWPDNPERMASQVHEHQAIIDAIKANDVPRAVQALQYHESTAKNYLSEKTLP